MSIPTKASVGDSDLSADARRVAEAALAEDDSIDVTSEIILADGVTAIGSIRLRSAAVVAGTAYAGEIARLCGCHAKWALLDGADARAGDEIGRVHGDLARVLRAERPLLNVLQRACGIATATREYVRAVQSTRCIVLHTRKTAPGLRGLDVRSVAAGGGGMHRTTLGDTVLVKDNHWRALAGDGDLIRACEVARGRGVQDIYVEVESEIQLRAACGAGATRLLLDNQPVEVFRRWARIARELVPDIEIEATGGITLATIRDYAVAGADFVSVGALTHSVVAADVTMDIE